jgi:hypothetical protein
MTSEQGSIRIGVWRESQIIANGTASAIAVAASPKGGAPAVGGAGTMAFNRISGSADAYAEQVLLRTLSIEAGSGQVSVTAHDDSMIDAYLRSVAAAVSISGGKNAVAVAVGLSVARNIIGARPVTAVYDVKATDYNQNHKLTELKTGTRVLNDSGMLGQQVYQYIGDTVEDDNGIELRNQNYSDESTWKLLSYGPSVAAVQARLSRASVDA